MYLQNSYFVSLTLNQKKTRLKSLFTAGLLLASLVLFNSCSKDDAAPKLEFVFDGETISLTGANLYLTMMSEHQFKHTFKRIRKPPQMRFFYFTQSEYPQ